MEIHTLIEDDLQSLFLEEYRGDICRAYNHIVELETQLQNDHDNSDNLEQNAHVLQSKIKVDVLRGRLDEAYIALAGFKSLVDNYILGNGPRRLASSWGLRYASSKLLVDYYRRYPPCIRYQHESQSTTNAALMEQILGPTEIVTELNQNIQKYCANATEDEDIENQAELTICMRFMVLVLFPQQLRFLATYHPAAPDGAWKKDEQNRSIEQIIASAAPQLANLVQSRLLGEIAEAKTLYSWRLYLELHYAMASPSLATLLAELSNAYNRLSDSVGMGNCKLIEGDSLYSPSFTSPIIQNLIPVPTCHACGDSSLWDGPEGKIALKDSEDGFRCYEEAVDLFEAGNSPRGKAAAYLRLASIMHARSIDHGLAYPDKSLLQQAGEYLDQALALFDMDEANQQVVKTNQILLNISKGQANMSELRKVAGAIGRWGRESCNELIAYHLGMVMIRFARREWEKYSRFDTSSACYECAYECCTELGARVPAFIALFARACLQDEMRNTAATAVLADQCMREFDGVVESLNQQVEKINVDSPIGQVERQHILTRKFDFIFTFNSNVIRILAQIDSVNLLENYNKWQVKYRWYEQNDEGFAFFRNEASPEQRKLQSDIAKNYLGQPVDAIIESYGLENTLSDKFWNADVAFNQAIADGDLDGAESSMHDFIKIAQSSPRVYAQYMFQMISYARIGDIGKTREILDSVTDVELFNNRLDEFLAGKKVELLFFTGLAGNAITVCVNAMDWKRGLRILKLALKIRPSCFDESPNESPIDLSIRQCNAATIYLRNNQPERAFRMLLKARRLVELRRSQASDMDARVGVLSRGLNEVFLLLIDICLKCAKLGLPVAILDVYDHGHPQVLWEEHALLFMEEARARSLVDSLSSLAEQQSNEEAKKSIAESIYKRRALTHLQSIKNRTSEQDEELAELVAEVKDLDIGSWSSTANDLMDTMNSSISPRDLFGHLSHDTVVIEASFNISGCAIMAITTRGIEAFETNTIRDVDIRKWTMELMQIMRELTGLHGSRDEERKSRVEELSQRISDVLLKPFEAIIQEKKHIIFSLSQPLTAFPVSALIYKGKPLILHAAVSQAPSLTALYHLSKRRPESALPSVSVFTKAVSDEKTDVSGHVRATREPALPMAGIEAISISKMFSTWPVEASTLSRSEFKNHIQGDVSILHIGTHGTLNNGNPLLSSISIGEEFRVIDMSPIQSRANLIVFAACLSGLGKATSGNDVLGFTHVVLGTGCQAYIGTLFEVDDFESMILMTLFYRQIKEEPNLSLAEALRRAQMQFLDFDAEKASAFLDHLLEVWDAASAEASGGKSPEQFVPDGRALLSWQKMMLPRIDWSSPIFWASFTLMGYGDFRFTT